MKPYKACPYDNHELITGPEQDRYYKQHCSTCPIKFEQEYKQEPDKEPELFRFSFELAGFLVSFRFSNKPTGGIKREMTIWHHPPGYGWDKILETESIFIPDFSNLGALKDRLQVILTFS